MTRIRIKQLPTNSGQFSLLGEYMGFNGSSGEYFAQYLRDHMGIKSIKVIVLCYRSQFDPFGEFVESRENGFSCYTFIDFEWAVTTELLDHSAVTFRDQLTQGLSVMIPISPTEIWKISPQNMDQNLLLNTQNSTTTYFVEKNQIIPEDPDEYEQLVHQTFETEPFTGTGTEEEPRMGYRDAYINMFVEI